jgi:hypothetical protein
MTQRKRLLTRIATEHLSIPTLATRKSDALDFHTVSVWAVGDALTAAFEAGQSFAIQQRKRMDIHELLEQHREIALVWGIEDVQSLRPDLNGDQCWKVLQRCQDAHDCNHGITWDLIDMVASDLFPEPHEGERP